jgi:hypothetical protein
MAPGSGVSNPARCMADMRLLQRNNCAEALRRAGSD